MKASLVSRSLAAAALLGVHAWVWASVAPTTYSLNLSGNVQALSTASFDGSGRHYDTGVLDLSGVSPSFSVVLGDTVEATITLTNGPFVLPASPEQFFGFNVTNTAAQPPLFDNTSGAPGVSMGSLHFYLGGTLVYEDANANCGNCASLITFAGPGGQVLFDKVVLSMNFGNLSAPYAIDGASISYQLSSPVPEPSQGVMMLCGLIGAGVMRWRRVAVAGAR